MKDLDGPIRRYARPIAGKYTVEQLEAQVGKEIGVVCIVVPIEWVNGGNMLGNRQQIPNRVGPLLGDAICCRIGVFGGTSKPTGAVSIPIQKLSEEGAVRLGAVPKTNRRERRTRTKRGGGARETLTHGM